MTLERNSDAVKPRAASVFDVAKAAGVSHQTVSRVLNEHPSVRPATKQKVLDAMRDLNYRPNLAARALVTSRSRIIGILSTSSGEYGPASSIAGVEAAARGRGYSVNIANADGSDQASIDEALNHLVDLSVEGLVVVAPQLHVLSALSVRSFGIPYVTLQRLGDERGVRAQADSGGRGCATRVGSGNHGGATRVDSGGVGRDASTIDETAALPGRPAQLAFDQVDGARMATAHLIGLGHRRIAHVSGPADWIDASSRLAGFQMEMAEHGLDADVVIDGDWSATSGYRAARDLLHRGVTAVFSSNDQMALGLLHAFHDAGLELPRDLSVVGFDDIPEAEHFWPPLTTVRQDFDELGRRCVAQLLGDGSIEPSVDPTLVERGSTAPPPFPAGL
jgi:DNA-binding LacI/PurR family transcriptional regulator